MDTKILLAQNRLLHGDGDDDGDGVDGDLTPVRL